jgi:hypothetical protein
MGNEPLSFEAFMMVMYKVEASWVVTMPLLMTLPTPCDESEKAKY